MGWFVFACFLGAVSLAGLIYARKTRPQFPRNTTLIIRWSSIGVLVVGVLVWFFSSLFIIPPNSIAIVTSLGQPIGTANAGPAFLAPWDDTNIFSTQIQVTQRLAGTQGDVPTADCVQVNLSNGASACADITIRYIINPQDAVALWHNYGDFDTARDKFLRSATDNAAKIVYGKYDPQSAISGKSIPAITTDLTDELNHQLNQSGLTLVAVAPGQVHLDPTVFDRLNGLLNTQTDTQIAQQLILKNQAQAQANAALNNSLTPAILTQECIDAAKTIKPAYFNCFSGSTQPTPLIQTGH